MSLEDPHKDSKIVKSVCFGTRGLHSATDGELLLINQLAAWAHGHWTYSIRYAIDWPSHLSTHTHTRKQPLMNADIHGDPVPLDWEGAGGWGCRRMWMVGGADRSLNLELNGAANDGWITANKQDALPPTHRPRPHTHTTSASLAPDSVETRLLYFTGRGTRAWR